MPTDDGDGAPDWKQRLNDYHQRMRRIQTEIAEHTHNYGDFVYRTKRYYAMKSILERARLGALEPNWRDRLTAPDDTQLLAMSSGYQLYSDMDTLLLTELQSVPHGDWEPNRGVGWRRSLDSWLATSNNALDQYRPLNHVLTDSLSAATLGQPQALQVQLHHQFTAAFERDMIEASYKAGLCAGGEQLDWRGWLRQRATRWPDVPAAEKFLVALHDPHFRDDLQTLPDYW